VHTLDTTSLSQVDHVGKQRIYSKPWNKSARKQLIGPLSCHLGKTESEADQSICRLMSIHAGDNRGKSEK
jgi:hypothetical protein